MSYDLGHPADEGGGFPPYLCPLCGTWHAAHACPLDPGDPDDGPSTPPDGPDEDDWPMPEEPPEVTGSAEYPAWCYGLPPWIDRSSDN